VLPLIRRNAVVSPALASSMTFLVSVSASPSRIAAIASVVLCRVPLGLPGLPGLNLPSGPVHGFSAHLRAIVAPSRQLAFRIASAPSIASLASLFRTEPEVEFPGAEVYCAATVRDQAKIVWSEAARMRDRSPALKNRVGKFVGALVFEDGKMTPVGADADVLDGLNPHIVIIDELHGHRTRAVLDVMDTALGARRQPLLVVITTAGSDRATVCWEQHAYAEKVLAGTVEDDSTFAYIATIDEATTGAPSRAGGRPIRTLASA
jgi:hypothetical protein